MFFPHAIPELSQEIIKHNNRERLLNMCSPEYRQKFEESNPHLKVRRSATGNTVFHNTVNKELLEARKKALNITNKDICNIFQCITGKPISTNSLTLKLNGQREFTSSEILILSHILNLQNSDEVCEYFNLKITITEETEMS